MTIQEGARSARKSSAHQGETSRRALGVALAGGVVLFACAPAFAQEPVQTPAAAEGARAALSYGPDFFTRFAPKTALDMVGNIPGFSIKSEGQERGLGQASENVLINGRRVSGKNNGAETALGRIGAEAVTRIEIVDGASLDIPGLSGQVANVIANLDKVSGSWWVRPQFREERFPAWLNGGGSLNGRTGDFSWSIGVGSFDNNNGHDGPERQTNAAGVLTETRIEEFNGEMQEPSIDATLTYETAAGSIANLNIALGTFNFTAQERSKQYPVTGAERLEIIDINEYNKRYEIGADYDFALGPGRLKLIGLQRMERGDNGSGSARYLPATTTTGQRFKDAYETGESIGRGEYGFGLFGGDFQIAAEGAFNYLETDQTFDRLQPGGGYLLDPTSSPEARIEEKRAEMNLSWSRPLNDAWTLQSSLGAEYSELDVAFQTYTAANAANPLQRTTRDFVRPKGYLALVWKLDKDTDINFKGERRVGQLDFGDFLTAVDLQNDTTRDANADLVPEQAWIGQIEANRNLGAWGAVKTVLQAAAIEDIVDRIPLPTRVDPITGRRTPRQGIGNIDKASLWSIELAGTLKFDPIGWKGAQLEFRSLFVNTAVDDPFTGQERKISGNDVFEGNIELRWDIPSTSWATAFGVEDERDAAVARLDARSQNWNDPGNVYAFIENKDVFGLKARLMVMNLADTSENFKREIYDYQGVDQPRPLVRTEERWRTFGPIVRFYVSGAF